MALLVDVLFALHVFAGIAALATAAGAIATEKGDPKHRHFGRGFLGAMGGLFVTAVSAVNVDVLPLLVRWLWPTVLGIPLIRLAQRIYAGFERPAETDAGA